MHFGLFALERSPRLGRRLLLVCVETSLRNYVFFRELVWDDGQREERKLEKRESEDTELSSLGGDIELGGWIESMAGTW